MCVLTGRRNASWNIKCLEITRTDGLKLILECQQHLGEDSVRAIAMDSEWLAWSGSEDTGTNIKMPVGDAIQARLFNVVGAIDD